MSKSNESEARQKLQLTMIVYGSSKEDPVDEHMRFTGEEQRRVEIHAAPLVPVSLVGNRARLTEWARDVVALLLIDVKHTAQWHCEFCDKLARETKINFMSWCHLTPPKVTAYMHLMCDSESGPCARIFDEVEREMATVAGFPNYVRPTIQKDDEEYPAAASCAYCMKEDTTSKSQSRCGKCKLIRYCSQDCQREDWPRHKASCKIIKEVTWVWK